MTERMFSLRSGVELGTDFPPQSGQSPGKLSGHMSQHPPAGSSREQPSWCAHFPGYHSSGFGCVCWLGLGLHYHAGCARRHRAPLVVCAYTAHPSFFAQVATSGCYLPAQLAESYPTLFPVPREIVSIYPWRQPDAHC